ncbi:MAG: alpha/beta hydrolase [Firmicutes bacterium]|nr:alpha/beta hydrolase [Bacillota bacterium]
MLLTSYLFYRIAFYSPTGKQNDDFNLIRSPQMEVYNDQIRTMIETLLARPYEPVTTTSHDGLRLFAKYYHQSDEAPLVICFHGYRGTSARDFSGGSTMYLDMGFNLLMVDERACCRSEGHTITFGIEERYDVLDWIKYSIDRFGQEKKILLGGISMGAGTVLMVSQMDLSSQVKGIIADCPFTSPEAIIRKVIRDLKISDKLTWPLVKLGARLYGHLDLDRWANAAEAVKETKIPIVVMHGEDDRFVPCDMSRQIAAANPKMVELHTFPGAGHGLSYLVDPVRYTMIVQDFTARALER